MPRASARTLMGAALAGSAVGLGLAAAYLAGSYAPGVLMRARAQALVSTTDVSFSEAALQRVVRGMEPGALAIAARHDPLMVANAAVQGRQAAAFAQRLERSDPAPMQPTMASLMLRPALGVGRFDASSRFDLTVVGALDGARDLECLTQAVYYEARGESAQGQAAVAQVVLNRVRHPNFPKTVCGVVFQGASLGHGCQFSFACDGSMHDRREPEAWRRSELVAARALGGTIVAQVGRATHFHVVGLETAWNNDMIRVAQVGMHVFYRFGHPNVVNLQMAADGGHTPAAPDAAAPAAMTQPVLASLAPPMAAPAPQAKPDAKAAPVKDAAPPQAAASAPAAVVQPTSGPAPAPAKAETPTA